MGRFPGLRCPMEVQVRDGSVSLRAVLFQEFLYFYCSHATGSCGSDGLSVAPVLHIATGEHTPHAREDVIVGLKVATSVGIELAREHLCVRLVTDTEKERAGGEASKIVRSC